MEVLINLAGIIGMLGLVFLSAFFQFSIFLWTFTIAIYLLAISIFLPVSFFTLAFFWISFLLVATFANGHSLRRKFIVKPSINMLKAKMPTISQTEREALEAGNTWWEKELFCGRPNWNHLLQMPKPSLSPEEQSFIDNQVEHLCELFTDWEAFKNHDLPEKVWRYLKKEKFFGMNIPKEYEGLGFSAYAHSTVITKIATRSISAAVTAMVPNSLGPGELLIHYGTDEQKRYYLPRLARGEEIPCFALTSPEAGSDAGGIPDIGIVTKGVYQNKETIGIRLTWDKRYITLAPVATVLGLAFKLYDPDKMLSTSEEIGITLCLIPTSHEGVEIGNRHSAMNLAFMNGTTRGKDVFIPLDWIIGGLDMAGQGWRMLMECLSIGRSISLPALSTASVTAIYSHTGAYASIRKQFNVPLAGFEGVEESLGHIAGYAYILEASRLFTAGAVDQKIKPAIASAIAKYHMTELCRKAINHGMDVHGGHGIQMGPRNLISAIYLATPISITVEGANILTRNLIIFGQGAIRCHPFLLQEVALISEQQPNVVALDRTIMSHIGFFVGNWLRTFAYGITGGALIRSRFKNSLLQKSHRQLTRMSTALSFLADSSLILLGGSLKRRERTSARLGDIMSQLYLASAVLKFYHDRDETEEELDHVLWVLKYNLNEIQKAITDLCYNYPIKSVGYILKWFIFPFGMNYQPPSDGLHHQIAKKMVNLSKIRERLTQNVFVSNDPNDLANRLERGLSLLPKVSPILKKLHHAFQGTTILAFDKMSEKLKLAQQMNLISQEEADLVNEYETLRKEIIKVNEFNFDLDKLIA